MKKYFLIFIFLFFVNDSFSEEFDSTSLASTEGISSSLVNGSVCAISGDYTDHVVDLVIPGPTPLIIQRTYRSSDLFSGHLYRSWKLSEPNQLEVASDLRGSHRSDFYATVTTAQGAKARYHKFTKNTSTKKEEFEFSHNKGFTNCGMGFISGKTNLKNNRLYLEAKKPKEGFLKASLVAGDGQKRKYIYHYSDDAGIAHCELLSEELRNNTRKHFFYDEGAYIKRIYNKNWAENFEYGSFYFDRERLNKDKSLKIVSSLGHQVLYHFKIDKYKADKQTKYTQRYIDAVAIVD